MSDLGNEVPTEPVPTKTPQEIVAAKNEGVDPTAEERVIVKDYLWNNPTLRFARQVRAAFPEIQEEIVADCGSYDTSTDSAYTVQGEGSEDATRQAEGLNRGEWWVARFVGGWIDDPANGALKETTAREVADRHFRIRHGCES
jgi:hypothetical protein